MKQSWESCLKCMIKKVRSTLTLKTPTSIPPKSSLMSSGHTLKREHTGLQMQWHQVNFFSVFYFQKPTSKTHHFCTVLSPRYQKALAILAISRADVSTLRQDGEVSLFLYSHFVSYLFLIMVCRKLIIKQQTISFEKTRLVWILSPQHFFSTKLVQFWMKSMKFVMILLKEQELYVLFLSYLCAVMISHPEFVRLSIPM